MPRISSGLLMYRIVGGSPQVLLVHPGGPFFRNKDEGAWSIPKGEVAEGEDLLACARREFEEELGQPAEGAVAALKPIKQKGGKIVHAWCIQADCDLERFRSTTFKMEWPPRSGKTQEFPEIDRAEFFDLQTARTKINPAQAAFLDELESLLEQ